MGMLSKQAEKLLPLVQKPGRYTGGELNSVMKEKDEVEIRFAFCFPDTYEIGMSHLASKFYIALSTRVRTPGASVFLRRGRIWRPSCGSAMCRSMRWRAATL